MCILQQFLSKSQFNYNVVSNFKDKRLINKHGNIRVNLTHYDKSHYYFLADEYQEAYFRIPYKTNKGYSHHYNYNILHNYIYHGIDPIICIWLKLSNDPDLHVHMLNQEHMTNLGFFPKQDITVMHVSDLINRIDKIIAYFRKHGYQMNGYTLAPTSYNISLIVLKLRSDLEKIINLIAVKPDQMDCQAILDWTISQLDVNKLNKIQKTASNEASQTTYYEFENKADAQKSKFNSVKSADPDFLNRISDQFLFTESIIRFKNKHPYKLSDLRIRYDDFHDRIYYSGLSTENDMPIYWDLNLDQLKAYIPGVDAGNSLYSCNYPELEFRKKYQLDRDAHWSNHNYINLYNLEHIAEKILSDLDISQSNWNKYLIQRTFFEWLNPDHTSGKKSFDAIISEFESEYSIDRLSADGLDVVLDSNNLNLIQEQAVEKVKKFCADLNSEYGLDDYTKILQLGMKDLKKDYFDFIESLSKKTRQLC